MQNIPTPFGRWLRERAQQVLPVLVFAIVLVAVIFLWEQRMGPDTVPGEVDAVRATVTAPVSGMILEMRARDLQEITQGEILGKLLAADQKTIELKAPITGRIGFVNRHAGENVLAGDSLIQLTAARADRIVCYLRQPLSVQVAVGQPVRIRSRATGQRTGESRITRIATEMLPIRKSLLPATHSKDEVGLAVLLAVPEGLELFPGELVDVTFLRGNSTTNTSVRDPAPQTNAPTATNAAKVK